MPASSGRITSRLALDLDAANAYSHDRDLERRVRNYLYGHRMPALKRIDVEADNGTVVLRGRVYSFFQKQLCIHCCRRVAGVIELIDELEVIPAPAEPAAVRPR